MSDNQASAQTSILLENNQQEGYPLNSLSPIDDADKDGNYSRMLFWALNNRQEKDIKNIALTGPYGSGKSSVLKTFEKNHSNDELVFLNISLATFKEEKGESASKLKKVEKNSKGISALENSTPENNASGAEKQALLRLVELSILQQIFYHEKDEDIPDTRFKKTRSFSDESASWLTIGIFLFLVSLIYILYSKTFWDSLDIKLPQSGSSLFTILAWSTVLWFGFSFLKQSIRPLRSIQLKKFNFHDAEFAMDENISKSILNEHLDELLYFFEVTKYTVVVFEDLDRFEQTEIFTKLRELNHLINYSKKMNNRKVAFVYAVRDDMFQDKDRTKFFDFIIPIIPVVNSTNSNEILRGIVKVNQYKIKEDLLDNISLYVDDMRLLFNIMNEYYLYHNKLEKNLDQNKLLGILIYKNIYPNDFVDLSNNDGFLFNAIHKKDGFITSRTAELSKEIEILKTAIKRIDEVYITNGNELRKLYVLGFLEHYPQATGFKLNNIDYTIGQLSEEGIFNALMENNNRRYSYINYGNNSLSTAPVAFSNIESKVDPSADYSTRLSRIEDLKNGKTDELKSQINKIQEQINSVKHTPINTLLRNDLVEIKMENKAQQQLVSVLLRGDYINENYQDYTSIFYEGSLTKTDREFILNVKAHTKTEFDFQLNKIETIIGKIPDFEYTNHYVLNYCLLDYVLVTAKFKVIKQKIINLVIDESETAISFIDGYIDYTQNQAAFVKIITGLWPNIWHFIETNASLTEDRKQDYLVLLIEYADLADLQKVAMKSKLVTAIEENKNILRLVKNSDKFQKLIAAFEIKFRSLSLDDIPESLIDFVYEKSHYQINEGTLQAWMKYRGNYIEQEFYQQNYSSFNRQKNTLDVLIAYVDNNLTAYINEVWLKIDGSMAEDPNYFGFIIDSGNVEADLKKKLLTKNSSKIPDITDLEMLENKQLVIDMNSIEPTWMNLMHYFIAVEKVFDQHLIHFVNNRENAVHLVEEKLAYSGLEEGEQISKDFTKALILNDEISDDYYGLFVKMMPWWYNKLEFENLSVEKIEMLMPKLFLTKDNYDLLRRKFSPFHILLLETNIQDALAKPENFEMDAEDIAKILISTKFSIEQKDTLLHRLSDDEIIANKTLLQTVGGVAANSNKVEISKVVLNAIFETEIEVETKVSLYIKHNGFYDKGEFFALMAAFGKGFHNIKPNSKQTVISGTELNWHFVSTCFERGHIYKPKPDKNGIRIYNLKS